MSLFTYLLIAALAVAAAAAATATATATGEPVNHIRRLLSSEEADNPYDELLKRPSRQLLELGVMFGVFVFGFFLVAAIVRCAYGDPNVPEEAAASKRILPLMMSIEPALKFTNGLTLAGDADHPECTICLSEIVEGEEIRILSNCRHGFHLKCIETWLASRTSCPTCRTSCIQASGKNNPPENPQPQPQQQHQHQQHDDVDLEAADTPEIEMMGLQHQENNIDVEAAREH